MKVIKTEGTKTSLGSFMVIDDNGDDFCDEEGNNAWDTYEEAERIMKKRERQRMTNNYVHCLKCNHVYEEKEKFIEACTNCGNEDTEQTHYLQEEKE